MQLKEQQAKALELFAEFLADKTKSVFILKGYAGTGKTTLLKEFLPKIAAADKIARVMAPTGRAAKVLQDKTGHGASTIHRSIYQLDKLETVRHDKDGKLVDTVNTPAVGDKTDDDIQFRYAINMKEAGTDLGRRVYVIDESSMISSRESIHPFINFGTGFLLKDLLTFAMLHRGNKIVFVGDPAQLPPVGDSQSLALDKAYFEENNLGVTVFELTEVLRQGNGSAILSNAMAVRDLLERKDRNTLVFNRVPGEVEDIDAMDVVDLYTELQPKPTVGDSIVVCYTNAGVHEYNREIRETYFPGQRSVVAGDVLQIVKNNVNVGNTMYQLFNGDFVTVVEASPVVDEHVTPVWVHRGGKQERIHVSVRYRDVVLMTGDGNSIPCKIVENLLDSPKPEMTSEEHTAMYIDFMMRHENLRKEIRENKDALSKALRQDPFYNAVFAKFGYAITAHKSQGGEWKNVIVDYTGRTGLDNDALRWNYTATTRAVQRLWGVNMPNITFMSKLNVTEAITRVSKPMKNQLSALIDPGFVDALPADASASRRCKYLSIKAALPAGYRIESVNPCNYNDQYVISTPSGMQSCDCCYNGQDLFTSYKSASPMSIELGTALHSDEYYRYKCVCTSDKKGRQQFHNIMQSLCDELGITITGINEEMYRTSYALKTSGTFSYIEVWFNGKNVLTRAIASSDMGQDDQKLVELIHKLNNL